MPKLRVRIPVSEAYGARPQEQNQGQGQPKPEEPAWTSFQPVDLSAAEEKLMGGKVFLNSRYQVVVREAGVGPEFGRIIHLSIKRRDKNPLRNWRDLQRIKTELVGPEYEAVEIFPKESQLVDLANQYHLWVFVSDYSLPFGFHQGRMVGTPELARQVGAKQERYEK